MASTKELAESYKKSAEMLEKRIRELLTIPSRYRPPEVRLRLKILQAEQNHLLNVARHLEQERGYENDLYCRDEI